MYISSDNEGDGNVKIYRFSSSNGMDWTINNGVWTQDDEPLLKREDFGWTETEIRSPSAIMINTDLYLYFAGHYFEGVNYFLSVGLQIYTGF